MRRATSIIALKVDEECLRCETFMSMKAPDDMRGKEKPREERS